MFLSFIFTGIISARLVYYYNKTTELYLCAERNPVSMKNTWNILIVHNKYQFAGGEDTVVEQDSRLLQKYGHNVIHYYRNNNELHSMNIFQKLCLPFTTFFSFRAYRDIKKLIKEHNIDIVHVHNTLPLISYSVYYAAKKSGCCLVQTIHNFRLICPNGLLFREGQICQNCLDKGLFSSVRHGCYRNSKIQTLTVAFSLKLHRLLHTFHMPDAYITMTEFNKQMLSSIIPADKFFFKANYLEKENLPDVTADLPKKPYFVYASRVETVKGIFVVLEAFKELKDEHIVIIGNGPEDEQVAAYIAEHHMTNVTLAGFQPHEKTVAYLQHAKATIFPSLLYEGGFPLTIIESFSVSTPVIVSDSPNISSNIKEGVNGFLFETGSSASLIEKIKEFNTLAENAEKLTALKSNAYHSYEETYTQECVYKRMHSIYETAQKNTQGVI